VDEHIGLGARKLLAQKPSEDRIRFRATILSNPVLNATMPGELPSLFKTEMKLKRSFTFFLFQCLAFFVYGQVINGVVSDRQLKTSIANALVRVEGTSLFTYTNANGGFSISLNQILDAAGKGELPLVRFNNQSIGFTFPQGNHSVQISDLYGKKVASANPQNSTSIDLSTLVNGMYLVQIQYNGKPIPFKVPYFDRSIRTSAAGFYRNYPFQVIIEKDGYQTGRFSIDGLKQYLAELEQTQATDDDCLLQLIALDDFRSIESKPLIPYFGEVTSVKFLYEIKSGAIYYINAKKHLSHSYFAMDVLGYPKDNYWFNIEQYRNNANRTYYPGTIDYFRSTDKYVLHFFASDDIACDAIKMVYQKIRSTTYFDNKLYFYANSLRTIECKEMSTITSEELYAGQNYQCLNPGEAYGYLQKTDFMQVPYSDIGYRDIVIMNGIPVDVPVVAGIITTEFQTPLSHINVLSINRKTPNMALRNGWENETLMPLTGKLVYLKTDFENYEIREATIGEAQKFWDSREPKTPSVLKPDLTTQGLVGLNEISIGKISVLGGKAANFGELAKVKSNGAPILIPEGAFAIPFYYYHRHMQQNGFDTLLENMLDDDRFKASSLVRRDKLALLQARIIGAPVDQGLIALVEDKMKESGELRCRFRSSTNAEDIDGFNGAGLYDSKTGIIDDPKKSVAEAIVKVWASLWNFKAFEEREYFRIDQRSVAMGILVHRSFPVEVANGVAITKNIYRDGLPGITINSQFDEISIVNPVEGWVPEQVIYYTFEEAGANPIDFLSFSDVPGHSGQTVLTTDEYHQLYRYCNAIIKHYSSIGLKNTFDIEFKIDRAEGGIRKLYIKQCRVFND
jgi:pyruvate, water dikinase